MFEEYLEYSALVVKVGALKVRTDWIDRMRAGRLISICQTNCKMQKIKKSGQNWYTSLVSICSTNCNKQHMFQSGLRRAGAPNTCFTN